MSTVSARPPRLLEHAELVLDLRAAGDEHERPLDLAEQAAEMLELVQQQQARVGGQQVRDGLGRGVRAVGRAEGVVHVEVAACGELAREALVVLRLARVEARVLEHVDPLVRAGARAAAPRPAPSRTSRGPPPSSAGRGASRRGPRPRRCSSRSSSVGSEARMRVSSATAAVLERHVQIGADQDGLARDVGVADRARHAHRSSLRLDGGRQRLADLLDEVDEAAAVAPLVVVPGEDLDERARSPSSGRCRRSTSTASGRCRSRRSARRCTGGCPRGRRCRPSPRKSSLTSSALGSAPICDDEVDDRAGRDRRAHRHAVDLPLQLGEHDSDRAGGAGRGRDQVDRRRTRAAEVLVRQVEQSAGRSCTRGSSS